MQGPRQQVGRVTLATSGCGARSDRPRQSHERSGRERAGGDRAHDAGMELLEEARNADEEAGCDVRQQLRDLIGAIDEIRSGATAQGAKVDHALEQVGERKPARQPGIGADAGKALENLVAGSKDLAVGVFDALGLSGAARGKHDGRDLIGCRRRALHGFAARFEQAVEIERGRVGVQPGRDDRDLRAHPVCADQRQLFRAAREHEPGLCQFENVANVARCVVRVEPDHDAAHRQNCELAVFP